MITFAKGPYGDRVYVDDVESRYEYFCIACGAPLIPVRGDSRRHHFRHRGERVCSDTWHGTYSDSDWHFGWEGLYPKENRERTLELGSVRHRADVLVGRTVVEFQHSFLSRPQFDDRNTFYSDLGYKVVWLFDMRDLHASGDVAPAPGSTEDEGGRPLEFSWRNPNAAFNAYDLTLGNIDLFLQLSDGDDGGPCIVRVRESSASGFESFEASRWYDVAGFLAYTGAADGVCEPPDLSPLEPNEDYLRFRDRHGVVLDAQQERAVQVVGGATLLLAVPGSGKTTTMVSRIGYLAIERGVDPSSIIAVTYGKSAAAEMRDRFAKKFGGGLAHTITFTTINALAYRIYRDWCDRSPRRRKRDVINDRDKKALLMRLYKEASGEGFVSEGKLTDLASRIEWAKNNMLDEEDRTALDATMPFFSQVYRGYQDFLRDNAKMDFDDQMIGARHALETDPALLAEYRARYRYWCVDEAQDTSRLQHALVRMLVGYGPANIFMVGDEDQSIYGYRGAFPEALLNFKFDYPNAMVLKMERNYRSGAEIVSAAHKFIGNCKGRVDKDMRSARGEGSSVRAVEVASRLDQFDEAYRIISDHLSVGGGTLGVIYRNNETCIPLVDQLIREKVPFTLRGSANTLFTSSEVRDVKAFMRLALNPRDVDAFNQVCMKADCYVSARDRTWAPKKAARERTDLLQGLISQMSSHPSKRKARAGEKNARSFASLIGRIAGFGPLDAIDYLLNNGYGRWLEENNKATGRIDLLKPIAARENTLAAFLERLDFLARSFDEGNPNHEVSDALTLATAHSCKGLEFDTVLILDAIDGVFPSSGRDAVDRSKDAARDWQEERRLFYVAMTRARDSLLLLRPKGEQTPFVDEVVPRTLPQPVAGGSAATRRPVASVVTHSPDGLVRFRVGKELRTVTEAEWDARGAAPASRYDIGSWNVREHRGSAYEVLALGDMRATVTDGPAGRTADLRVPLGPLVDEVAAHLGELSDGFAEFVLKVDLAESQGRGDVVVEASGRDALLATAGESVAAGLPGTVAAMLAQGTTVVAVCRRHGRGPEEHLVLGVDEATGGMLLSRDPYEE